MHFTSQLLLVVMWKALFGEVTVVMMTVSCFEV